MPFGCVMQLKPGCELYVERDLTASALDAYHSHCGTQTAGHRVPGGWSRHRLPHSFHEPPDDWHAAWLMVVVGLFLSVDARSRTAETTRTTMIMTMAAMMM